jgi:4-amino-4-deoxy-L-arabinose transferase-like glycosyltransferase
LTSHPATHLVLLAGLSIIIRLPFLHWPLISDEGGYAYTAYWWFRGAVLYSGDLWFDRPQAIFLVYKLGLWLIGGATFDIRLWGAIWAAGTGAVVYLTARVLDGTRTALLAGVICALVCAMPQIEGFTANAEVFSLLPGVAMVYCGVKRRFGAAGLCAALSLLLKPSGGSLLIVAMFLLINSRSSWQTWLRFGVSASVPVLASLAHGAVTVGLARYLFAVAGYRLGIRADSPLDLLLAGWSSTTLAWLPLALVCAFGIAKLPASFRSLVLVWIASSIIGVALGGRWHAHYFMQIVPPLAIGAAASLVRIDPRLRWARRGATALIVAVPLAAALPYWPMAPRAGSWLLYHRPGYQIAEPVAEYVRQHTSPEDLVYVAFFEADIYYLSQRRAAIPALFRLDLAHLPGMGDRLARAVEGRVPAVILLLDAPPPEAGEWARFFTAVRRGYHVERTFSGVQLLRRNPAGTIVY